MRRLFLSLLALFSVFMPSRARAGEVDDHLDGKWQVSALHAGVQEQKLPEGMRVVIEMQKTDHTFSVTTKLGTKVERVEGTWSVEGDQLTTVEKASGQRETLTVAFRGDTLTLTQRDKRLVLKRIK